MSLTANGKTLESIVYMYTFPLTGGELPTATAGPSAVGKEWRPPLHYAALAGRLFGCWAGGPLLYLTRWWGEHAKTKKEQKKILTIH